MGPARQLMMPISRRRLLAGGAIAGAMLAGPITREALGVAHEGKVELSIATRSIEVNGRAASVFGLMQPDGRHGLVMNAGQNFRVRLTNDAREPALIHWHGMTPPNAQDGVPGVTQPLLPPGRSYDYDFPVSLPGTNWMHSHRGLQEQRLMAAPLIVRDPLEAGLDEQEVVIMLHDFTFRDPEEILADLTRGMSHGAGHGMDHSMSHDMSAMPTGPMPGGAMPAMADLNDVSYDAYLANDRTLEDPEIVTVERAGRVRLRIINAAASTNFLIDLGRLQGTLIAVDGRPIAPVAGAFFPLAVAQRADIRLTLPDEARAWPILAVREGSPVRTGIILATRSAAIDKIQSTGDRAIGVLDPGLNYLAPAEAALELLPADRRMSIALFGDMMRYEWGLADLVGGARNISVRQGERVELDLVNRSSMSHPMHLHGHHFQIVGVDGRRFMGAVRDTVLVPIGSRVTIAFDAGNPGRWMFHCHNLYHMVRGMMSEVAYT